jgi:ABC-type transporter Mla subunit MlaD
VEVLRMAEDHDTLIKLESKVNSLDDTVSSLASMRDITIKLSLVSESLVKSTENLNKSTQQLKESLEEIKDGQDKQNIRLEQIEQHEHERDEGEQNNKKVDKEGG